MPEKHEESVMIGASQTTIKQSTLSMVLLAGTPHKSNPPWTKTHFSSNVRGKWKVFLGAIKKPSRWILVFYDSILHYFSFSKTISTSVSIFDTK